MPSTRKCSRHSPQSAWYFKEIDCSCCKNTFCVTACIYHLGFLHETDETDMGGKDRTTYSTYTVPAVYSRLTANNRTIALKYVIDIDVSCFAKPACLCPCHDSKPEGSTTSCWKKTPLSITRQSAYPIYLAKNYWWDRGGRGFPSSTESSIAFCGGTDTFGEHDIIIAQRVNLSPA